MDFLNMTCPKCGTFKITVRHEYRFDQAPFQHDTEYYFRKAVIEDLSKEVKEFCDIAFEQVLKGLPFKDVDITKLKTSLSCDCAVCGHTWSEDYQVLDSSVLGNELEKRAYEARIAVLSNLAGINCEPLIEFIPLYGGWVELIEKILKQEAPKEHKTLEKIQPRGGGGGPFAELGWLFCTISVGIATSFLWELIKKKSKRVRDILKVEDVKELALEKSWDYEENHLDNEASGCTDYHVVAPDIKLVLARLPKEARRSIIDDIALEYAMRVREKLLELYDGEDEESLENENGKDRQDDE